MQQGFKIQMKNYTLTSLQNYVYLNIVRKNGENFRTKFASGAENLRPALLASAKTRSRAGV